MPKRTDRTHTPAGQALQEVPEGRDEVLEAIGHRIREARQAAGLTGLQLAEKVGCSISWIYSLEGGLQNFTYAMFRRTCEALDVDFREVLIAGDEARALQTYDRLVELADTTGLKLGDLNRFLAGLSRILSGDVARTLAELSSVNDEGRSLLQVGRESSTAAEGRRTSLK